MYSRVNGSDIELTDLEEVHLSQQLKWYQQHSSKIIRNVGCSIFLTAILWLAYVPKHTVHHPFTANTSINEIFQSTPDTVYYLEEGVRTMDDGTTLECAVLSRYHVFADTTSTAAGEYDFCLPDGQEFGFKEPAMIGNDRYLIACFDVIQRDDDFCVVTSFVDNGTTSEIEIIVDLNGNHSELFDPVTLSIANLHSFAFRGDRLFGVMATWWNDNNLYHWDLTTMSEAGGYLVDSISITTMSADINLEDGVYPLRLEAHNGFLYLFQRFERGKGINVTKMTYFDGQIEETGRGFVSEDGHESLFNDFGKGHGFTFDQDISRYFMFSDCEMMMEHDPAVDAASFYLDSDFKFKFNASDHWTSLYHIQIPIVSAPNEVDRTPFLMKGELPYLEGNKTVDGQWVLRLDYSHRFVYFPIPWKEYQDSLYFMELIGTDLVNGTVTVKFHTLSAGMRAFAATQMMTGPSALMVVSGNDVAIQRLLDDGINDEATLSEVVEEYGEHTWAEAFYNVLQMT